MADNTQQFGDKQVFIPKRVNKINVSSIDQCLHFLAFLVKKLVVSQVQQIKIYGICCYVLGHLMNMCPTLQHDLNAQIYAVRRFLNPPQMRYDPYLNMYNQGWRDNPNCSCVSRLLGFQ